MPNTIVNIHGLAKLLQTSPNTLKKDWHNLPHFFIGRGKDCRGARFDFADVLQFLKDRDDANISKDGQNVGRKGQISRVSGKNKIRVSDQNGSKLLGKTRKKTVKDTGSDPFNLLGGLHLIP